MDYITASSKKDKNVDFISFNLYHYNNDLLYIILMCYENIKQLLKT